MAKKLERCEKCKKAVIIIDHLGKQVEIDRQSLTGFVYVKDEYGNEIGCLEVSGFHRRHSDTCDSNGKKENKKSSNV